LNEELRVLIVAEHASARFGGEAALPLHYFRVLHRRGIPVWLLTHARTRAELSVLYPGDDRILYVEDTRFHRAMWRLGQMLPDQISYFTTGFLSRLSTQLAQRRLARRLVREHRITVVHQPMPVSPREPSVLFGFGVPVVIGPMNGGMDYPPAFRRKRGAAERALLSWARASASAINRLMPGKRRAAALLVANRRTRDALPAGVTPNVIEMVENGVDLALWQPPAAQQPSASDGAAANDAGGAVSFVFMGRLVGWKAVDLLLNAFAVARRQASMHLLILGDGDERRALEQLAAELGIVGDPAATAGTVHFAGWLAQRDCAARLRSADCLVLPSLLECGGAVVLEAMSMGKPVIATAWGGPLDYLDPSCGMLVAPDSPTAIIEGLAQAMIEIAQSPSKRRLMGERGLAKVRREFDWELKVDRMLQVYRGVGGSIGPPRLS
jgi:glycosyltransferase involved in cell wall biosynthesis